ncbi:PEP-CTERM sorting domain-containing protein [Paucibacter sp. R3-3]|uniref:PEP-CTERM sorting domain-containing protein n=1 Tax=Roseateles agri TaxID=3098619 RepID=A0ABU5DQF2_9BURK|nr:PEP-CTERM sorting domain-containing protein [Paucibacter sp. R3-3]MDY0748344.1 PEP-CTERM sorting domain-containing protein [Paucibacter sp. R3-3]
MNLPLRTALVTLSFFAGLPAATAQVLYNPATGPTNPALTGWLDGSLIGASASYGSSGAQVKPSAGNAAIAGWSNYPALLALNGALPPVNAAFPVLDATAGYTLSFDMVLYSEDHSGNANRAGFSATLIGSDRKGVEIGFQSDRIFAQNLVDNSFVAGESTSDPALVAAAFAPNHRWELEVQGDSYQLLVNGLPVLSSALHDYSSYTGTGANAYRTPNFLFLGDNTTSAGASFLLGYAAISTVPEPAPWALLALGGVALAVRRRGGASGRDFS